MVSSGSTLLVTVAICSLAAVHATPGITDLFSWGLDYIAEPKSSESSSESTLAARECNCEGPACTCCVNFNLTFVDLGGPGCVKLKYLSQADGLLVNVSYGQSVLHSEQVKGPKPEPACMDLLSDLAQICARFTELTPEGEGLRSCAMLEPTLLGDVQARYSVGCFIMGPEGMKVDPQHEPVIQESEEQSPEEEDEDSGSTTDKPGPEEALINAVNQSAEEGIAWFTSLLGLSFGGGAKKNGTEAAESVAAAAPTPAPQRQRSLNLIPLK